MSTIDTTPPIECAVLVGIQLPGLSEAETQSSLDELQRLVETLGLRAVARLTQKRPGTGAATLVGEGKLVELARLTGGSGVVPAGVTRKIGRKKLADEAEPEDAEPEASARVADEGQGDDQAQPRSIATVVVVDHDLSPSQLRNLEGATSAEVLDRSSVILNIFQRHARTREAKVQVEIARLAYLAPRMRATGGGDRQRGGIGGKGTGESSLELDRRRVRDRIAELKRELEVVQREATTRRGRRVEQQGVAIVGYTNAGKSSLMRALTGSDVLIADKLFATLDTTVRPLYPETRPRTLVTDTVGFIKRLPHDLVASFRSTLEEARDAALLLHVVDASDPSFGAQLEVTRSVLAELGAGKSPALLVLNKIDRVEPARRQAAALEYGNALLVSAFDLADVARVHAAIVAFFEREMVDDELFVDYADARRIHEIHEACRVLEETHEETGTRVRVRGPGEVIAKLRASA